MLRISPAGGRIVSVSASATHGFSKELRPEIRLLAGLGVEHDVHCGATVRHLYQVRKNPTAANLCQVHLLQEELFAELALKGISVGPGEMGENVTTRDLDLLSLGRGTRLHLGASAIVEVTGLRDPCVQMNALRPGLMKACLLRDASGALVRRSGVMGIVVAGGLVYPGDTIHVEVPEGDFVPLLPV